MPNVGICWIKLQKFNEVLKMILIMLYFEMKKLRKRLLSSD